MRKGKDAAETLREAAAGLWLKGAALKWETDGKQGQGKLHGPAAMLVSSYTLNVDAVHSLPDLTRPQRGRRVNQYPSKMLVAEVQRHAGKGSRVYLRVWV